MSDSNNRRSFLSKALAFGATTALSFNAFARTSKPKVDSIQELPSLKGRKVLFTWGGWDGHEPKKFVDYLTPWMQGNGAEVQVFNTLDPYTDNDLMASTDLVIQVFTMSKISNEQEKGLLQAVKNGTGMAGWHGGMCDAFRNNVAYQYMTGGQWVSHPGGVIDYVVNIGKTKDPITEGLKDFPMKSEQYFMHVDPNVNVLATTRFSNKYDEWIDGCVMPVVWKKMYGKGRIFYTSLGHNLSHALDSPGGMEIIKRGIKWTSASKYQPAEPWLDPVYKEV